MLNMVNLSSRTSLRLRPRISRDNNDDGIEMGSMVVTTDQRSCPYLAENNRRVVEESAV